MNFQLLDGNNLKIRAVVEGEGPLVVLVHGWPESCIAGVIKLSRLQMQDSK